MLPKIVITDFIDDDLQVEREILRGVADVTALNAHSESELEGQIEDAVAVMMYHNLSLTAATIDRLKACQLIVRCGVGFDNVDRGRARERGIPVANVPDYGTEEVADSAIAMALSLARGVHFYNQRLRHTPDPWMYHVAAPIHRLRDRVFAVVGMGRIGTATALRAKACGMTVRFYDPYKPDGYDKANGVERVESLQTLLADAQILSVHCPLTPETHHMINAESISWMPRGGCLVNTARGDVVELGAVAEALRSGQLSGAAIDVLPVEPPTADDALLTAWRDPTHPAYDRLIINPHAAFYSEEGLTDMRRKGSEACLRAITGMMLRNIVN